MPSAGPAGALSLYAQLTAPASGVNLWRERQGKKRKLAASFGGVETPPS